MVQQQFTCVVKAGSYDATPCQSPSLLTPALDLGMEDFTNLEEETLNNTRSSDFDLLEGAIFPDLEMPSFWPAQGELDYFMRADSPFQLGSLAAFDLKGILPASRPVRVPHIPQKKGISPTRARKAARKSSHPTAEQASGSLGSQDFEGSSTQYDSGSLLNWDSFASLEYSLDAPPEGNPPGQAGHRACQTSGSLPEGDAFASLGKILCPALGGNPPQQSLERGSLPEGNGFASLGMTVGLATGGVPPRQGSGSLPMGALVEGRKSGKASERSRVQGMGRGTSLYRGVSKATDKKKWRAMLHVNHTQLHCGYFETAEQAARAYDRKALEVMGSAAITNFPISDYIAEQLVVKTLPDNPTWQQLMEAPNLNSAFRGVAKGGDSWVAEIQVDGKRKALGTFASEIEAARAYDVEAVQTWGRAAHTNLNIDDVIASLATQRANLACGTPQDAAKVSTPNVNGVPASGPAGQRQRSSKFLGVSAGPAGKWLAQVTIELGRFGTEEAAARAYDAAAVWACGLSTPTNFPVASWFDLDSVNGALPRREAAAASSAQEGEASGAETATSGNGSEATETAPSANEPLQSCQMAAVSGKGRERSKISRYKGVTKKLQRWKALIKVHGKRKELGSFATEEEAARCYDRHAVIAWGVRASTNFSPLRLLCESTREVKTILEAVDEGGRNKAATRLQDSGAISQMVAEAMGSFDSSIKGGKAAHRAIVAATAAQTSKGSQFRCVSAQGDLWRAYIYVGGRRIELGTFGTELHAAHAYDLAGICFYSNEASPYKARINFSEEAYAARMAELGVPGDWDRRRGKHMVLALCELVKARLGEAGSDPNAPPEHEQIPIIPYLAAMVREVEVVGRTTAPAL